MSPSRIRQPFSKAWLALALTWLALHSEASEKFQIQSLQELTDRVAQTRSQIAPSDILLVFDIDNTALTANQDLGGDAWFSWQEGKLKAKDNSDLVASDITGLLRAQGMLFALGSMHPPEPQAPTVLQEFQRAGHPAFMLTSRGSDFLSATQKELNRNHYDPSLTAPGPKGGYAAPFLPYDDSAESAHCLSPQERAAWNLPAAQPVVYQQGVMYTGGQHKGAMLRTLLCKTGFSPKAVFFVDDQQKHVDRVTLAFAEARIPVVSLRYGKMDGPVHAFEQSDKHEAIEGWNRLKQTIDAILRP